MSYAAILNPLLVLVITSTMLALGMGLNPSDLLATLSRFRLMLKIIVAAFGISVAFAWLVLQFAPVSVPCAGALLLLMCMPPAATSAKYAALAGADQAGALAMLVLLSAVALVATPLLLSVVLPVQGPVDVDSGPIVRMLLLLVISPVAAGLALRRLAPSRCARLRPAIVVLSNLGLVLVLALVVSQEYRAILATPAVALATFPVIYAGAYTFGWLMTGPDPRTRFAGAMSCATRNPSIALLIVNQNFPVSRIGEEAMDIVLATIVTYAVMELCLGVLNAVYHARRLHGPADP
jgi:BASS family bile acid:Na+ symporter